MTKNEHRYAARLIWDGNTGEGTASYAGYGRQYRVFFADKPALAGSADPTFRGDADRYNPEELLLAAISGCHMLSYLALCARKGICVLAYEDDAQGAMLLAANGGGKFEEVVLHPAVTIADKANAALAAQLHHTAHERCFIASSCNFPIRHEADIRIAN